MDLSTGGSLPLSPSARSPVGGREGPEMSGTGVGRERRAFEGIVLFLRVIELGFKAVPTLKLGSSSKSSNFQNAH